ncbi:E3 ubiquitin- ligase DZIP3 [Paramuricea clavata]|uniref:E3 ubiquitin- ligase DZIP3 n=1 Tax=Paramuricea clavata TaxID=317549 RepID=A0A6S7JTQ7_PARCT|nr:E3 ubiquitin- ligase DZIP3 [Paramuricea clavata]
MCGNVDGFCDKLTDVIRREHSRESLSDAFRILLNDPLHALDRREPMLIVVDALDESKTDVKSEFLELITDEFPELPEWIKILITSRPELQVRKKLQHLNPVEILPDDYHHKLDLEHFIHHCLPNMNQGNVSSLISKCEGSFLYAYYSVNALKKMDLGIEPNLSDYVPKGISGFYEKQFGRLKTGLQRSIPDTWSSVFKSFLNVVAASREPLPMKLLVSCMGFSLSSEEYVMRETIIGIMSEILPLYDDCLTVYHKSLWDWLTLDGYEEHAFVGDVANGTKRLWRACSNIYRGIDSLSSVLDFLISPEKKYALKNGGKYLLDVGVAEDFHWLVNVRLNFLKLKFFDSLNVRISGILKFCYVKCPDYHYWGNIHLHFFSQIMKKRRMEITENNREIYYIYLQSLANGYFDFVQRAIHCKNEARDILDKSNEIWVEEIGNDYNSNFKIISHTVMGCVQVPFKRYDAKALSPDNKLLAYINERTVEVFELPSLIMVFDLEISELRGPSRFLIFSPDSLYILWNSVRSCISIREQKEVPLIPHGPLDVHCCSFSSCGTKLVTCEKNLIKVWDVRKRSILVQVRTEIDVEYCMFSNCNSCILARSVMQIRAFDFNDIAILESTTLERIDLDKISCADTCLTNQDYYQIISPSYRVLFSYYAKFEIRHFHLPSGRIALIANQHCSKPFTWKDKKCVIFFISGLWALVYDFINNEVVQFFHINCLPNNTSVDYISKLGEMNLFVCLSHDQVFVLSLETPTETSVVRSVYTPDIRCYALSPENLYVACCDKNRSLEIKSVDNGKTLQTVELKQPPEACWWSELYLWVVCKGVVVKYPYNPTQTNVLGDELEDCDINFQSVLKFAEGVLVIQLSDNEEISLLKICNQMLYPQQIPKSNFNATSIAVSSDGCAILLYHKSSSDYQLWEIASENRWELRSTGRLKYPEDHVAWFCLTGTENSRSSIWVTYTFTSWQDPNEPLCISSIDFPSCKQVSWHELPLQHMITGVIYVDSNIVIIYKNRWIYFVNVSDGKIITSLDVGLIPGLRNVSSFYIASRSMLLLGGERDIIFFKIHNIESSLPSVTKE